MMHVNPCGPHDACAHAGRPEFAAAAMSFWRHLPRLAAAGGCDGLLPTWFAGSDMQQTGGKEVQYGMGASADSAYEYMLKQWIMSGKEDRVGAWGVRLGFGFGVHVRV